MSVRLNEDFIYQVLSIVEEIPYGCVATYGQIASLSGNDGNARLVGKVMGLSDYYGRFPCHRVVNCQGRCAPGWFQQRELLMNEGVIFKENGNVNLRISQWKII